MKFTSVYFNPIIDVHEATWPMVFGLIVRDCSRWWNWQHAIDLLIWFITQVWCINRVKYTDASQYLLVHLVDTGGCEVCVFWSTTTADDRQEYFIACIKMSVILLCVMWTRGGYLMRDVYNFSKVMSTHSSKHVRCQCPLTIILWCYVLLMPVLLCSDVVNSI